ncbi:MAG: hypothetical protein ACLVIZ_03350 [Bifidobacterium pseudocatenulatum]
MADAVAEGLLERSGKAAKAEARPSSRWPLGRRSSSLRALRPPMHRLSRRS